MIAQILFGSSAARTPKIFVKTISYDLMNKKKRYWIAKSYKFRLIINFFFVGSQANQWEDESMCIVFERCGVRHSLVGVHMPTLKIYSFSNEHNLI